MKHGFSKSFINPLQCGVCKRDMNTHGSNAVCEGCSNVGSVEFYPNVSANNAMTLCEQCINKEKETELAKISAVNNVNNAAKLLTDVKPTYNINDKYSEHKTVIECRQEFYNLEARAIIELKSTIDNDVALVSPEQKRFKLAEIVQQNILTYQAALFEISEKQTEITNRMRANIVYFNGVIDELRSSEREQLKLKDASYVPVKVKPMNAATPTVKLSKTDKTIDAFAKYHKISFDDAKRRLGL